MENHHWHLIRCMRRGSAAMWRAFRPMPVSSWGVWASRNVTISKVFPLPLPSNKRWTPVTHVRRWEPLRRYTNTFGSCMPVSGKPSLPCRGRRWRNIRWAISWKKFWVIPPGLVLPYTPLSSCRMGAVSRNNWKSCKKKVTPVCLSMRPFTVSVKYWRMTHCFPTRWSNCW